MKRKAYYVGTHRYSFRAGQPAEIIGIETIKPGDLEERVVFKVRFLDGYIDLAPVSDTNNYKLLCDTQVQFKEWEVTE